MLPVGFKLTISAGERPYALDLEATGTGKSTFLVSQKLRPRLV